MTKPRPEYHLLPTDAPVRAVNILLAAAGLEPLDVDHSFPSPQDPDDPPSTGL